jgi:hypothetical protein
MVSDHNRNDDEYNRGSGDPETPVAVSLAEGRRGRRRFARTLHSHGNGSAIRVSRTVPVDELVDDRLLVPIYD